MLRVVELGLVYRLMGLAGMAISLSSGCSGTPAPKADVVATNVTPIADKAAAELDAEIDEPAAEEVADAPPAGETGNAGKPKAREAAKPVVEEYAADVPPVLLSAAHRKLCKTFVGDVLPTIELPKLGAGIVNLESLAGSHATVVLFWTQDAWMSETALRDLARDVAGRYPSEKVGVVGVAVSVAGDAAEPTLAAAGAEFPQLIDAEASALAQVGEDSLPRVYVLDGQRRIAWFDIEYSESTRRELQQTLAALAGGEAQ